MTIFFSRGYLDVSIYLDRYSVGRTYVIPQPEVSAM